MFQCYRCLDVCNRWGKQGWRWISLPRLWRRRERSLCILRRALISIPGTLMHMEFELLLWMILSFEQWSIRLKDLKTVMLVYVKCFARSLILRCFVCVCVCLMLDKFRCLKTSTKLWTCTVQPRSRYMWISKGWRLKIEQVSVVAGWLALIGKDCITHRSHNVFRTCQACRDASFLLLLPFSSFLQFQWVETHAWFPTSSMSTLGPEWESSVHLFVKTISTSPIRGVM